MILPANGKPQRVSVVSKPYIVRQTIELLPFLLQIGDGRSRTALKSLLTHRRITVNGAVVTAYNYKLQNGDQVEIKAGSAPAPNPNHKIQFVYENKDVIVIDKKHGTLDGGTVDDGRERTAYSIALERAKRNKQDNVFLVHRLEREASGLLLMTKSEETQLRLREDAKKGLFKRTFVAVLEGKISTKNGHLTHWLKKTPYTKITVAADTDNGGMRSELTYKTLKSNDMFSLVEICLITDRKHQIRAQFAAIGHPVAGDKKYGSTVNPLKRLCLHASKIVFYHPITGKKMEITTPIPKEFM